MKKKKILLGLALAAAAVFSLASCGDDTKPADNGGSQVTPEQGGGETQTQKYSVTYHTTRGTAPAAVANVTALPATLPTLTDDEYNFLGWSKTENGTTLVTAGSAITANTDLYAVWQEKAKFTVTYHTAHGTAPDALVNVRALPETLPTLTDFEYNFLGWTATENGTTLVTAGSAISANTDLYAVWVEKGAYDKFVSVATNNQTLILNENFNETTSITKLEKDEDAENVGVFNKPSTKGTPKDGSKYDLEVSDGKAVATDNDATVNKDDGNNNGKTQAIISYAHDNVYKKIEGYVDVTLATAAGSWTFMQLVGTDDNKDSGEVFGLRTVKVTENKTDKIYLKYRVDGGAETNPENDVIVTANSTYGILYSIDLVNSKITIKIVTKNATCQETITDFVADKQVAGLMHAEYMNIQSSDKNSNLFSIDNVAVSGVEYEVSEYKELMLNMYTPYLEQMAPSYTTNSAAFNAWKEKFIAAIQNSTTIEEIKTVEDMDSDLMKEFLEIKSDIQIAIESAISEIDTKYGIDKTDEHISAPNYTINESTFLSTYAEKLKSLYNCTTVEAVTTAKNAAITALDAIEDDATAKAGYIASVKEIIQTAYPATNYSYTDTTYNNKTAYDNALSSVTGDNKKAIDDSASTALQTLANISTNAELLAQAKTDYKASVSTYKTDLSGKDVDAGDQTEIDSYYNGTEYSTLVTNTQTDIDSAESIEVVKNVFSTFTSSVDSSINAIVLSLEDYVASLNDLIGEYKTTANEKIGADTYFNGLVNAVELLEATDYADKTAAKAAYENVKAEIDGIVERAEKAFQRVAALRDYRDAAIATLLDQDTFKKTYVPQMNNQVIIPATHNIEKAETEAAMDSALEAGKTAMDEFIASVKAETEVTVKFVKNEGDTVAFVEKTIIKNTKVTVPNTEPTLEGFKFAGWDFDFDTEISSNETIVAKWHDTYATPKNTSLDFSGFDYSENSKVTSTAGIIEFYSNNSSDKVENSMLWINGATKSSRYVKVVVDANATITIVVNPKDKDRYVAIASSAGSASGSGYTADTNTLKKASKNVDTTMTFNVTAGTYYINTSDKLYFKSINVEYSVLTEIKEIKASIANDANLISVSNVKLIDIDDNEIAITEGYNVSVVNSANEVVDNWQDALPAGNYKVYVQYGSYTQIVGLVQINGMA